MRVPVRLALVITLVLIGCGLVLGTFTTSTSGGSTSPYLSSLSDAAVGYAAACPPGCTNKYTGPRHLQCLTTTNCTNCIWNDNTDGWQTVPC